MALVKTKPRKLLFQKEVVKEVKVKEIPRNLVINFQTGKGKLFPHAELGLTNESFNLLYDDEVKGKMYLVLDKENGFKLNELGNFSGKYLVPTINECFEIAKTPEEAATITNLTFRLGESEVSITDGDMLLYPLQLIGKGVKSLEEVVEDNTQEVSMLVE